MTLLLDLALICYFVFDYIPVVVSYLFIQLPLLNQLLVSHANATLVVPAPVKVKLNSLEMATALLSLDCKLF
jgi:hypothetical protein